MTMTSRLLLARRAARSAAAHPIVCLVPVLALTAFTYRNVRYAGYVYDDHRLVESNAYLHDVRNASRAFRVDLAGGTRWKIYRPLVAIALMLEIARFGPGPGALHVSNLAWHLVAVAMLYLLLHELVLAAAGGPRARAPDTESERLRRYAGPIALAGAALFAVHPVNSEVICWVSRRADVMAAAFIFAALSFCVRGIRLDRTRWMWAACALVPAALLCKEIAVVLPPALALLALAFAVTRWSRLVPVLLAWLCLPLYLILRIALFGTAVGQPVAFVQNWMIGLTLTDRALALAAIAGRAEQLLTWPRTLSADYSWRSIDVPGSLSDPLVLLAMIGAAVILGAGVAVHRARRTRAVALTLAGVAALAWLPVSNLIIPIGTAFGERLLYVPSAALCGLVALGAVRACAHRASLRVGAVTLLTVLVLLGALRSAARVTDWRDDRALFSRVLDAYPDNVVALTYRAIGATEAGDSAAAIAAYEHALDVLPTYHLGRVNLAIVCLGAGDLDRAEREAQRVVIEAPTFGAAHLTLARVLRARGRYDDARTQAHLATRDPLVAVEAGHFLRETAGAPLSGHP